MQIFPYILTRIGGGTFNNLYQTDYSQVSSCLDQLQLLESRKSALKQQLCNTLLEHIQSLTDPKAQNQVQNVRRDIFNDRSIKAGALLQARQHLTTTLATSLDEYLALLSAMLKAQEKAEYIYNQLTYTSRQHLQQLAGDENLQKGLVLSSQTLLQAVRAYMHKDPAAFKKKEFQTEQSLLKYLTRMYTKTSPFSTFNTLALGTLSSFADKAIQTHSLGGKPGQVAGHIRLNNQLFRYLKDLFAANRDIYRHLMLRPNPTIARQADHFLYLTNHQNVEAFQRIPANPVLALLLELMQQNKAGIRFTKLIQEVCEYVDASDEAIEQYIRQLVSYGFFEYELGVSGTDPDWDKKLTGKLNFLERQQVAHVAELNNTLVNVRRLASLYAHTAAKERQEILHQAYQQFRGICMKLHEAAGLPEIERKTIEELQLALQTKQQEAARIKKMNSQEEDQPVLVAEKEALQGSLEEAAFKHRSSTFFHFKPEQIFYEDATRKVSIQLEAAKIQKFTTALSDLLQELRLFEGIDDEREQMKQYFLQKYGAESRISLLNFYEDFYRDIKKPEAARQAKVQKESLKKASEVQGLHSSGNQNTLPDNKHAESETVTQLRHLPDAESKGRHYSWKQWMEETAAAFRKQATAQKGQIEVPLYLIRQVNAQLLLNGEKENENNSFGAFIQFYQEKDAAGEWQLRGVLNGSFAGYGKMISRFLHIFPQEVTHKICEWNEHLQGSEVLFIENGDASYFNANLHPPLMPYEIRTPGAHTALPVEKQLPVTEFDVCLDETDKELRLMHKPTSKRAYVFDLGFQGHGGRSPLFQLLDKFTKARYLSVHPLLSAINTACAQVASSTRAAAILAGENKIQVVPRIVYENQIVLQRKRWYVPKELIPQRQPGVSD